MSDVLLVIAQLTSRLASRGYRVPLRLYSVQTLAYPRLALNYPSLALYYIPTLPALPTLD